MKPKLALLASILILFFNLNGSSQDSLPLFSVKKLGKNNLISWRNKYTLPVTTLNIQKSFDSIAYFSTIASMLDPTNETNGYLDRKNIFGKQFYRLFIVFEGGSYLFTKSMQPVEDSVARRKPEQHSKKIAPIESDSIVIKKMDTVSLNMPGMITSKITPAKIEEYKAPKPVIKYYTPSKHIFVGKENNVNIQNPDTLSKNFTATFFDEKGNKLFNVKLQESYLVLEKVNFGRSGWYYFQLFNNSKLVEKNKFYIPREGKYGIPPNDPGRILRENEL